MRTEIGVPLVAALAALAAVGQLFSQRPERKPPAPELVHLDARVVDAAGRTVPGLTAADFEILQAGEPRPIKDVTYVQARAAAPDPTAQAFQIATWPNLSPVGIRPDDDRLTMLVVIDDLRLSSRTRSSLARTIGQFIDSRMQARDLAAIVLTRAGTGPLERLTSDKRLLDEALAPLTYARVPGAADAGRDDAFAEGALTVLRSVLIGLRDVPGRKAVVFYSENMLLFKSTMASGDPLASLANRASVVFYTVDPRGLTAAPAAGQTLDQIPTYAGLGALARDTGGIFFDNTNDVAAVWSRALEDLDGYYRIAYAEDEPETNSAANTRLLTGITVKARRADLRVRARTGYPRDNDAAFFDRGDRQLSRMLPVSPFASGDLRLRVTPMMFYSASGAYVEMLLHLDLSSLTYSRDLKGFHKSDVELAVASFGRNSLGTARVDREFTVTLPDATFEADSTVGLNLNARLAVNGGGAVEVEAAARNPLSGRIGSARQIVDLPDLKGGELAISGITLSGESREGKSAPDEDPAVRIFKAGRTLNYTYSIYNARKDAEDRAHVEVVVRVFRDGQQIYATDPAVSVLEKDPDPVRRTRAGNVILHANASPGRYFLQLVVTDKGEPAGAPRTAVQSIDFEVK